MTDIAKEVASTILGKAKDAPPTISRDASLVSIMSAEAQSGLRSPTEGVDFNGAPLLPKSHVASEVDDRDVNTPDNWVPRHPDLIRLTGKHPFNCEPPLSALVDNGFITPPSLHFVRNHGYVPERKWETHTVEISGCVGNPTTLGMDDIVAMDNFTIPVTLVCAGNRRKEENMVKQTIGFSWGCAGHSTNFWTGVRLRDLLLASKIDLTKAKHVCFVGAEDLPNGKYGTSIPISRAMDEIGDVMIAYYQNGVKLAPDHGYPVRVIIPGWIGGRMVKWLTKIEVTEEPSDNYYHFFDNRIMPPHVDAELAKAEGWWYKPEYLFNELNINSAMARPAQGEIIKLSQTKTYEMKGYAYSGGGRRVTRVEVSVDGGKTWRLTDVVYPEQEHSSAPKNGRHWCWVFWTYKIDTFEFLQAATGAKEVCVRAWDESNNVQPANITWNLMGMGNNCHFRTRIHPEKIDGEFCLRFEHPTVAGPTEGGWMKPPVKPVVKVEEKKVESKAGGKTFTMEEIEKHNTEEDAWIIVRDRVYDCTKYLADHPGGEASIVMNAGTDTTEEFDAIHSQKAQNMLEDWYIGDVAKESKTTAAKSTAIAEEVVGEYALDAKKWIDFKMIEREELSRDSRRLRFALKSPTQKLGLPVGHHFLIRGRVDGKLVIRAYTPTSSDEDLGMFELVIKVYFANEHPKFPEGGKLSQYLESLAIGDSLSVRGPLGHYEYKGSGQIHVNGQSMKKTKLGFICGGTGITPAYQIIKAVCRDPTDQTEVALIYGNKTEEDILLKPELDELAAQNPRLKVFYTLDSPPADWKHGTGFVCEDMIRNVLPAAGEESFVGMCGPPPMIEFASIPNLEKVGYKEDAYVAF